MNVPELFGRAVDEFDRRVLSIQDDQWSNTTPCSEWSVRDLVEHVVIEDLWAPSLLAGKTIEEIGGMVAFSGDLLGHDPKASWASAAAEARKAISRDGAMETTTHLSFGDFPGSFYALQLMSDHLIHAWDLARAIGSDELLDPELVSVTYKSMKPYAEALGESGAYAPAIDVPDAADPQTRLLALVGRRA